MSNTLEYNADLSSNLKINAIAGYDYQNFASQGVGVSASNFPTSQIPYKYYFKAADPTSRSLASGKDPSYEQQSYFGRVKLNFKDKFILARTLRADGSSKFGA